MVDGLKEMGKYAAVVDKLDELRAQFDNLAGPNTLFLVLSNGTCLGLWESDFVAQLKK
jgi:UDP-N-acetylmuramate: L-alanyl-gamma-D-glutamyl-meso-diaminopimelate ligase